MDWATYLGGLGVEANATLAVDPAGDVLVAGTTDSPDFPLASDWNGAEDGFFARFDHTGHLLESVYIGTSGTDRIAALTLSANENAFVAGSTEPGIGRGRADVLLSRISGRTATGTTTNPMKPTSNDLGASNTIIVPPSVTVGIGVSTSFPVSLSTSVPLSGSVLFVQLASDNPSVSVNPQNLLIQPGANASNVNATVTGNSFGTANITAKAFGYTTGTSSVSAADTLVFNPTSTVIVGASNQSVFLIMSAPAPTGGVTINLSSSNPSVATVPATVTIPATSNNTSVMVTGLTIGTTVIHASSASFNLPDTTATITVNPPLAMVTSSINNSEVGVAFSQTLVALGGRPPYKWSLVGGALPTGLSLDPATGQISGTPSATISPLPHDFPVTFQVTDTSNPPVSRSAALTMRVLQAGALLITTPSLPTGETSFAYSKVLTAAGGTPPYVAWSITLGQLPNGLTLDPSSGTISGTPTAPVSNLPLTFKVTDSAAATASASLNLTIVVPVPTSIVPSSGTPQSSVVNTAFATPLAVLVKDANGFPIGSVPVSFAVTPANNGASGAFAGGITTVTTNSSGIASTVFTANKTAGSYSVTATVTNLTPVKFFLTNVPDQPASITVSGGNSQVTAVTITFPAPLKATVKDQFGNLVSGATVTFTAPATGASATFAGGVTTASTDATGTAASGVVTANGTPGTYSVIASVPPGPQTTFTLTNVLGIVLPANVVVAPGQSTPFNVTLGTPTGSTGMFVTLTSSDPTKVAFSTNSPNTPGSVFFPPGSQNPTAPPPIFGIGIGSATITASAINFPSATQTVLATYTITFSPKTVQVQTSPPATQLFMFLNGPAPAGGLTVNVSSSNTSVATVPSTVTFQANSNQTNLPATIVGSNGSAVIHASLLPNIADATANLVFPLKITTQSLSNGPAGTAYSQTLAANGGATPYTWSLTAGTLPAGLSLDSVAGTISGTPTTPTQAGSPAALTFKVTDASNPAVSVSGNFTLAITPQPLAAANPLLSNNAPLQQGVAYSTTLVATGGTPPLTWSNPSANLPAGLTLNAATGAITGTPAQTTPPGNPPTVTFQVKDSGTPQQTASASVTMSVLPSGPLAIPPTTLNRGTVGTPFAQTLQATGGTFPYSWSVSPQLPTGLTLSSSGVISGTPTAPTTPENPPSFSFKVTDATSTSVTANLSLTIVVAPLVINTSSLGSGQVNVSYSQQLSASGGTPPFTWSLTSGTLPNGLTLNTATGLISGTPQAPTGSPAALTFSVIDHGSPTPQTSQTTGLTMTIAPQVPGSIAATGGTSPQSVVINSAFTPLQVLVQDTNHNPMSGAVVTFTAPTTGASGTFAGGLSTFSATTNASGVATAAFAANSTKGSFTVAASTANLAPAIFALTNLQGPPATMTINSGNNQSAVTNNAFLSPFSVTVKDAGSNPVSGAVVAFAAPTTGASGTFASGVTTAITNAAGVANSVSFTANGTNGSFQVTATSGAASTTFSLTSTLGLILSATQIVVAPGGQANFPVSIGTPAPSGGIFVTMTSSDPTTVSVTSGFIIPQNATAPTTPPHVNGLKAGTVTITAAAQGLGQSIQTVKVGFAASFSAPAAAISSPATSTNLLLALAGGATAPSNMVFNLSSSNPAVATVPQTITIFQNATNASVPVTATGFGAATIHASSAANNIADTTELVSVVPALQIQTQALSSVKLGTAYSQSLTAVGGTPPYKWQLAGDPLPSGLTFNTATGLISGTPTGNPVIANLTFTLTDATLPTLVFTAKLSLAVLPAPPPTCANVTIGQNLQFVCSVTLVPASAVDTTVTVTSSNPSTLLASAAPDQEGPGTGITSFTIPAGSTSALYYLQALVNTGTTSYAVSAPGYSGLGGGVVTFQNSGLVISGPGGFAAGGGAVDFATEPGAIPNTVVVQSALLDGNGNWVANQAVRGGWQATASIVSSNSNIGTLRNSQLSIQAGSGAATTPFTPTGGGHTFNYGNVTISLQGVAGGFSAPAQYTSLIANVTANGTTAAPSPLIVSPSSAVGQDLEVPVNIFLPAPTVGQSTSILVTSSNPAVAVVSAHNSIAGTASVNVSLPSNTNQATVYLQGVATTGVVTLTATLTATNQSASAKIMVTPSGIVLAGPNGVGAAFSASAQTSTTLNVSTARLDSSLNYVETQLVPANTQAVLTSSVSSVGTVTASTTIAAGTSSAPVSPAVAFYSLNPGTTTIAVTTPSAFSTPNWGGTVAATVVPMSFSASPITVGHNLETSTTIGMNGGSPDPTNQSFVTLTMTATSGILLSRFGTDGGFQTIGFAPGGSNTGAFGPSIASGHAISPTFFIYGNASPGTPNLSFTVTGTLTTGGSTYTFTPVTVPVTINPSGFVIATPNGIGFPTFAATNLSKTTITISSALLDSSLNYLQTMPLAGNVSATVNVQNSSSAVGTLNASSVFFGPTQSSGTLTFTAASAGSATLTAVAPSGYNTPANPPGTSYSSVQINVALPSFAVNDGGTIGKNLAVTGNIGLGSPATANLQVTLASNDTTKLLLAKNATDAGSGQITFTLSAGATNTPTYFVYSLGNSGTASYTVSALQYSGVTKTDNLAPSGVTIQQGAVSNQVEQPLQASLTTGPNPLPVTVTFNVLDASNNVVGSQALAGGFTVQVPVTSSDPTVGANTTATITGGSSTGIASFVPLKAGTTTLTANTPAGYSTANSQTLTDGNNITTGFISPSVQVQVVP